LLLVLGAVAGSAGLIAYRAASADSLPAIVGVVRETEIRIAPETDGRLTSILVASGQQVRKGDALALLSAPDLTAAVEQAKTAAASARADRANVYAGVRKEEVDMAAQNVQIAESNLALAQVQYSRAAALAAREFATKQHLDETDASLRETEAKLARLRAVHAQDEAGPTTEERAIADAKVVLADAAEAALAAKLAKTRLVAPADGTIGVLVAEFGEVVSPGESVMTLEAGRERWFTFTIREDHLHGLSIGSPLVLRTEKGDRIDARVTELRPLGEFATWRAARAVGDHDLNSFLLRADPVAETHDLEPGMTVWMDRPGGAGAR
jgi:HlyD family secretion protein